MDVTAEPSWWIAPGEVRVSGLVEPAELTLVSPLQSRPCVYDHRSNTRIGSA